MQKMYKEEIFCCMSCEPLMCKKVKLNSFRPFLYVTKMMKFVTHSWHNKIKFPRTHFVIRSRNKSFRRRSTIRPSTEPGGDHWTAEHAPYNPIAQLLGKLRSDSSNELSICSENLQIHGTEHSSSRPRPSYLASLLMYAADPLPPYA